MERGWLNRLPWSCPAEFIAQTITCVTNTRVNDAALRAPAFEDEVAGEPRPAGGADEPGSGPHASGLPGHFEFLAGSGKSIEVFDTWSAREGVEDKDFLTKTLAGQALALLGWICEGVPKYTEKDDRSSASAPPPSHPGLPHTQTDVHSSSARADGTFVGDG